MSLTTLQKRRLSDRTRRVSVWLLSCLKAVDQKNWEWKENALMLYEVAKMKFTSSSVLHLKCSWKQVRQVEAERGQNGLSQAVLVYNTLPSVRLNFTATTTDRSLSIFSWTLAAVVPSNPRCMQWASFLVTSLSSDLTSFKLG